MEYISGMSLKHLEFTPHVCNKIYQIDIDLKTELLSHNDMNPRNIILSEKNDLVIIDYGETSYCV